MRLGASAGLCLLAVALVPDFSPAANGTPAVDLMRVPQGGIQPQLAVDQKGTVHLIYLSGDPAAADIYYVHKAPSDSGFSLPVRVNSQPGSAIAVGTIRGPQLAIGRAGRVHVAWNGSNSAAPKAPDGSAPMLYTRLNDAGTAFEPQRNLIRTAPGLDGGGSLAADPAGNVLVFWHAPRPGTRGETNRTVWVARSEDDGRTFAPETPAWAEPTGACGCCGMRAFAAGDGAIYVLYRAATGGTDRDMVLLVSHDHGRSFAGTRVHKWKLEACPMSSAFISAAAGGPVLSWETQKQIYFAQAEPRVLRVSTPVAAPGEGSRKHPVSATNARGETILVWTEGTGWKKGGAVRWQVFEKSGRPGPEGGAPGLPAWSLAAVFPRPDGGFGIVY